jgi:hypothetical protein
LHLAKKYHLPFGIEAPGYTLESIASIDPSWIDELRDLTTNGPCEFIGSGYSQMIGPIVPAKVNAANLRIGNATYEKLLGFRPAIAFLNEQAYASGLVKLYIDAGFKAIVMEWENPFRYHPEWQKDWRFYPQYACDQQGNTIPLIWNMSLAFQKFQRYAHGEIELDEYFDYLMSYISGSDRVFPIYGNDVEIFNFRPGRYHTEADLQHNEWERIEKLFADLVKNAKVCFIPPSQVLKCLNLSHAGNFLHLESPEQPIPVKKQRKYNISRWAVTGRDSLSINTSCRNIYTHLSECLVPDETQWKELCYLWSSDFRTHITKKRWTAYKERLNLTLKEFPNRTLTEEMAEEKNSQEEQEKMHLVFEKNDRFIVIDTPDLKIKLNRRKGLVIEDLWFKKISEKSLICTLPLGFFDDIHFGADFYSGHFIIESLGQAKITDLVPVSPQISETGESITLKGAIATPLGPVQKTISVSKNDLAVGITYDFRQICIPKGSFRVGHITLNPAAFDYNSLFYATHNGGYELERFELQNNNFDLGKPISYLVSTSQGFGLTEGVIEMGDASTAISLEIDMDSSSPIGFLSYEKIQDQYFFRISFSLGEMDETSKNEDTTRHGMIFSMKIQPKIL